MIAMKNNPEMIIETDDDNLPLKNFFLKKKIKKQQTYHSKKAGWLNVYKKYTKENIWPRGFALEKLNSPLPKKFRLLKIKCPIQQGLADKNPDVDAIYRLTSNLPISFNI